MKENWYKRLVEECIGVLDFSSTYSEGKMWIQNESVERKFIRVPIVKEKVKKWRKIVERK